MIAKPKASVNSKGLPVHYSVGAIIYKDGKYLLIDRVNPPFGCAAPAGHVDEGEGAESALVREIFEESGLKVKNFNLLDEEMLENNVCSKGIGIHYWYLYSCDVEGGVIWNKNETRSIDWYTPDQIKKLSLEPVWEYWFKKHKII